MRWYFFALCWKLKQQHPIYLWIGKSDVQVLTAPLRTKAYHKMYLAKQAVSDKFIIFYCEPCARDWFLFSWLFFQLFFFWWENWALALLYLVSQAICVRLDLGKETQTLGRTFLVTFAAELENIGLHHWKSSCWQEGACSWGCPVQKVSLKLQQQWSNSSYWNITGGTQGWNWDFVQQ